MRSICSQLFKITCSWKFIVACGLFFLICLCTRIPAWQDNDVPSLLRLLFILPDHTEVLSDPVFSIESLVVGYDHSEWFSIALPVIGAFAAVNAFADEWNSPNYHLEICRQKYSKYALSKLIGAGISGCLVVLAGLTAYILVVCIVFSSVSSLNMGNEINDLLGGEFLSLFIGKVWNLLLVCFIWCCVCTILIMIIKNRFVAMSIVVIIQYVSMKTSVYCMEFIETNADNRSGLFFIFPTEHEEMYHIFPTYYHLSFWIYTIFEVVVFALLFILFRVLQKRRLKNG